MKKILFCSFVISVFLLSPIGSTFATPTHHIINFGDQFGATYSPDHLDVVVGDTIIWTSTATNDFSLHDLESTSVPPGAPPIGPVTTGSTFAYVIQVPGEYDYHSKNWDFGSHPMRGTINAVGIHNGLTNEGREFYLGEIYPNYNVGKTPYFHVYAMINTYYANEVTVNYYDETGNSILEKTYRIAAKSSIKLPLDTQIMRVDTSSDEPAYNSCHIVSKLPITVEYLSVGQCSGGSYLALPAVSMGKKYVAACYNDNPGDGYIRNNNNSGGAIMIIGTADGTYVQIIPTTTTTKGHVGAIHGIGSAHFPVPYTKFLNKGQTYFLHSSGDDNENDMSGSIIQSNNPVVVISGHENAFIGGVDDPYVIEGRDFMVEQMVPYELWDSVGYISIPFVEPLGFANLGHGDKYRAYTFDDSTSVPLTFNSDLEYSSRFNFAAPLGGSTDIVTPMEVSSANGKKISVMQYDERSQPKNKPWPAPSMMTVVPRSHWKKFFSFTVLDNGDIQHIIDMPYINVISDHLDAIRLTYGANVSVGLNYLTQVSLIPNVSLSDASVSGAQYRLTAPVYTPALPFSLVSDYPFMVYFYEMRIVSDVSVGQPMDPNVPQEYAAPAGMALNTGVEPQLLISIDSTTSCTSWHVTVNDASSDDPGIKTIMMTNDPDGIYFSPGAKTINAAFDTTIQGYTMGEYHPFLSKPNDPFSFNVNVINSLQPAIAPIVIVDNKGNAKYFELQYKAPALSLALNTVTTGRTDSVVFPVQKIGDKICSTFVLRNIDTNGGKTIQITQIALTNSTETAYTISQISHTLPFQIAPGDSLMISLCYFAADTLRHRDSVHVQSDCFGFYISLDAHGQTGLIFADDIDYGYETVSMTSCRDIQVKNVGNAPLRITSLQLSDDSDFSISPKTEAILPITLKGGATTQVTVCFSPKQELPYSEKLTIVTDLAGSFANQIKSFSYLTGTGVALDAVPYQQTIDANTLKINPNPASGNMVEVTFPFALVKRSALGIRDVLGRELYHKDIDAGSGVAAVPITNLTTGIYYIQLDTENGVITQKLEVVR
jgi:plastocyanin